MIFHHPLSSLFKAWNALTLGTRLTFFSPLVMIAAAIGLSSRHEGLVLLGVVIIGTFPVFIVALTQTIDRKYGFPSDGERLLRVALITVPLIAWSASIGGIATISAGLMAFSILGWIVGAEPQTQPLSTISRKTDR